MLISLQVQNFRKLREKTFTFAAGMNVIRGANEQGKSTMLEAISYALFGSKALREPLEDTVTWGEDAKALKVVLAFALEGVTYTLKRSKAGAEMRWGDNSVVGQTEVTAKVGRLFGTAPANIPRLVLAGQGNIRGALEEGPKAATELIEMLANFGIVDDIITLIGEKLLTGPTAPFEDKISRLTPELADLQKAMAEVPDTTPQEDALSALRGEIAGSEATMSDLSKAVTPLAAERDAAKATLAERGRLDERFAILDKQRKDAERALAALEAEVPAAPDMARLEELQRLLMDTEKLEQTKAIKAEIDALPKPAATWTITEEERAAGIQAIDTFNAETNRVKARTQQVQKELNDLTSDAREKRAQRVMESACGICGKDVSELPEVQAKNDAIEVRLAQIAASERTAKAELQELALGLHDLQAVYTEQAKVENLAARYGDLAAMDKTQVPWKLTWGGQALPDNVSAGTIRLEVAAIQRQVSMQTVWRTRVEQKAGDVARGVKDADAAWAACSVEKFAMAEAVLPGLEARYAAVNAQYTALMGEITDLRKQADMLEQTIRQAQQAYEFARGRVAEVTSKLEDAEKDLTSVVLNNALLKRVRAARPIIANKLWTMVLSAVSRYFSLMRGAESVVTKDGDGFKVNGKSIAGLSGSTLDVLGLAIRLALVRTFLPAAPFLILDEPSAACDTQRTEAMMGFLLSAGFDQMLVVTHEDTAEQIASSLIEI